MLFDNLDTKKISDDIFVVKNFILQDECESIVNILNASEYTVRKDNIFVYNMTKDLTESSNFIENKIKENISLPLMIKPGGFNCISKGNLMSKHNDLDGFDHKNFSKKYGVVLYLNNFEGGEINYPKENISYHPQAGDLIAHRSYLQHEVLEVKSNYRYTYTSYLWSEKNVI